MLPVSLALNSSTKDMRQMAALHIPRWQPPWKTSMTKQNILKQEKLQQQKLHFVSITFRKDYWKMLYIFKS